jgi:hypothetical protein
MRVKIGAGLFYLALAAGCSSSGPSSADDLNILLNNQTGRVIIVELTIGGTLRPGISINNGAFVSDEFSGGAAGQAITIKATTNDGNPVLTATRQCTPKSTIFGGTQYGQIDFASFAASGAGILCQDPGTWQ